MIRVPEKAWAAGLAAIALVAAGVRIALWTPLLDVSAIGGVPVGGARAFEMLAWNVLDGIGFRDVVGFWPHDAFEMPLFPVFLAGLYALFGESRLAAEAVLCGISVATCLGVAGIGRLAFGSRAVGLAGGLLAALYVPFVAQAIAFDPETFLAFLVVLGIHLLLRAALERGRGFALAAGVTLGAAGLTRLAAFAFVPVALTVAVMLAAEAGRARRITGRVLIPCVLAMVATFSIWPIRNLLVLGEPFPGSTDGLRRAWAVASPSPELADDDRARRALLWRAPDDDERARIDRVAAEITGFVSADPARFTTAVAHRAARQLDPPPMPPSFGAAEWLRPGLATAVWLVARIGIAGIVVALFRRFAAGALLGGGFVCLAAFDAVTGRDLLARLPGEWTWILGAAYLLLLLARIHREPLLAAGGRDADVDPPLRTSLLDRHAVGVPLAGLALLPFAALAVVAPIRRAALESSPPAAPARASDGATVASLRAVAASQSPDAIRYPREIVTWRGELSHFVARPDGSVESFSFRPGKAGLAVGEAHVACTVAPGVVIPLPPSLRLAGTVTGAVSGTGVLGEPTLEVTAVATP